MFTPVIMFIFVMGGKGQWCIKVERSTDVKFDLSYAIYTPKMLNCFSPFLERMKTPSQEFLGS